MPNELKTVCVVGLGYIGLPTAATLAASGIDVKGVDIRQHIVDELNEGRAHFSEPDLDTLVRRVVEGGQLKAFTEPQPADAFIITVPTPVQDDKSPDMSYVERASRAIAPVLKEGDLVILESTSPLGATQMIADIFREERSDLVEGDTLKLSLAYCPERILPGQMVRELVENDRIVGGITPEDAAIASALYGRFVRGKVHTTNATTAEMVKLIENAYRDVNIAFANEIANIAEKHNLDAWRAIELANHHPRVNILNPGPGVGGHCIAVDPWFLISQNNEHSPLMAAARGVNDARPEIIVSKVDRASAETGLKRVACLGLSYKPDVDDLRESPAVEIASGLANKGYKISVVEPHIDTLPARLSESENLVLRPLGEAVENADIILLLVGHSAFTSAGANLENKIVIDAVGLWREPSHAA